MEKSSDDAIKVASYYVHGGLKCAQEKSLEDSLIKIQESHERLIRKKRKLIDVSKASLWEGKDEYFKAVDRVLAKHRKTTEAKKAQESSKQS